VASIINDIVNAALVKVGATTISNLTDGTVNANFMNTRYEQVRDMCLARHPWNFATKRAQLAQLSTTPAIEFDFEYQLPADFIRVVSVHSNNEGMGIVEHKVEDGKILTSSDQCWLVYIYRMTNPNQMSAEFREFVSAVLAKEAAMGLVNSNTMLELMTKEAEKAERRARGVDAQEDLPTKMPAGSWVNSRTGTLRTSRDPRDTMVLTISLRIRTRALHSGICCRRQSSSFSAR